MSGTISSTLYGGGHMLPISLRRFRWISLALLFGSAISTPLDAQSPERPREPWAWKEETRWENMPFSCRLKLSEEQPEEGQMLYFDYEITAEQPGGTYIYNPFLVRHMEVSTCRFLVYTDYKGFPAFGNDRSSGGAFGWPDPTDWVYLPQGATIKHRVPLAIVREPFPPSTFMLRPGKYHLQLAFSKRTTIEPPRVDPRDRAWLDFVLKFRRTGGDPDYVRSNPVAFEVK